MKKFLMLLIVLIFILFLNAYYIEPSSIKVREYNIYNDSLPSKMSGLKIAHFSDVLYQKKTDLDHLENIVKEINNQNPDLIVFTGNLINKKINEKESENLIKILNKLDAKLYKYAILGDKDNEDVIAIYEESDFIFLNNNATYLFNNDVEPILIVGGDNITAESYVMEDEIPYSFALTLISKPDYFDDVYLGAYANVVLAGHSLGGLIRLPFWGALFKEEGAMKYTNNYYQKDNNELYISYGVGTNDIPFRLFNPSSINIYRLNTN